MDINNIIETAMQSMDFPLLTAFILGLLVALNPCQLSINISAITYILKTEHQQQAQSIWSKYTMLTSLPYAMGKTVTYTGLGWILMCLIGGGSNISGFSNILSKTEVVLPYLLIAIGLYLLTRAFHHHVHHGDSCHHSGQIIRRNGSLGSLILGMTLALAFCPESAIFYFGIMLPLSVKTDVGVAMPLIFGIGASVPVVLISWIMHVAMDKAKKLSDSFERFQQILNIITGLLFLLLAYIILSE